MRKIMKRFSLGLLAMVCAVMCAGTIRVSAAEGDEIETESPLLYVTGYEITNETITPGDDFVLTITLENYNQALNIDNVYIMIQNPDGVAPEYGTVSQKYIGTIDAGESKNVSFNYTSLTGMKSGNVNFTVFVSAVDTYNTSAQLRIPVGRVLDFEVEEVTIPKTFVAGKTEYVSAMIENVSGTGVNNVTMVARCDEKDIATVNIGTMSAGTTKTQYVSTSLNHVGKHTFDLVLTYTDGEGNHKEYVINTGMIEVKESSDQVNTPTDDVSNEDSSNQNSQLDNFSGVSNIVIICISGILLIAVCCVILLLIYRRK